MIVLYRIVSGQTEIWFAGRNGYSALAQLTECCWIIPGTIEG